jgi:hypothetical protein
MRRSSAALPAIAHTHGLDRHVVRRATLKPVQRMIRVRPAASCCFQIAGFTPLRCMTRTPTINAGSGASINRSARMGDAT